MDGSSFGTAKARWLSGHLIDAEGAISWGGTLSFIGVPAFTKTASAHPYNESAMFLIEAVSRAGGMALDCGAGRRNFTSEHVVQIDVAPSPNIDVLADAQRLPFVDDCFDLVLSFDVLEHVLDPYRAAAEMRRVLKPGGTLLIDLPFLQVEHGYPDHFTNFSRSGVRALFSEMACEAHVVPASGHPSHVVRTALHTFMSGIPEQDRARFQQMTVAEILARPHKELRKAFSEGFNPDVLWKMAASTQALFLKPGSEKLVGYDLAVLPQFR